MATSANASAPALPPLDEPATLQPPLPAGGLPLDGCAALPPVPVAVSAGGAVGPVAGGGAADDPLVVPPVVTGGAGGGGGGGGMSTDMAHPAQDMTSTDMAQAPMCTAQGNPCTANGDCCGMVCFGVCIL